MFPAATALSAIERPRSHDNAEARRLAQTEETRPGRPRRRDRKAPLDRTSTPTFFFAGAAFFAGFFAAGFAFAGVAFFAGAVAAARGHCGAPPGGGSARRGPEAAAATSPYLLQITAL